jgi:ketosteroid isomerase-like protein
MNTLQAQPVANPMNTDILRPKSSWRSKRLIPGNRNRGKTASPVLLTAAILALSAPIHAQNAPPAPVEIVNLEQHLWTTMAEGDFATVRSLFTKDFIEVDDKIQAVDALLVNLKHCKLQAYELRDLQVRVLSPDSALTAYHMVSTFNCGTGDKSQVKNYDNNATTTWVRQPDKKWLVQAHTETPIPAK